MHAWESIQKAVDYIEEHLAEELNIEDLAQKAHLSVFYFQRLFSRVTKKTVREYIKLRRVALASTDLIETDKKIITIALENGFNSHETFTKAFKEVYGISPEEYRKTRVRLNHFLKPNIDLDYKLIEKGIPLISEGIVLEINEKELGKDVLLAGLEITVDNETLNKPGVDELGMLWDKYHNIKGSLTNIINSDIEYDIMTLTGKSESFSYLCGSEVTERADNLSEWTMEKGKYLVCEFEAEDFETLVMDTLFKASKYFFETWIPNEYADREIPEIFSTIQKYFIKENNPAYMEIWVKVA